MQTFPPTLSSGKPWKLARLTGAAFTLAAAFAAPRQADAAFGVTTSGGIVTVDTGAGLVYQINSGGDIPSIKLNGNELNMTNQSSCINSGFGATSVTVTPIGGYRYKITCVNGDSYHYYLMAQNQNIIYMATYAGHDDEWRFIPRLQNSKFKTVPYCSDYTPGGTAIESADTIQLANGDTVSKYYGNAQMEDDVKHSVSGTAGTATMWMGNRETSSGGPFFRDIQTSAGSTGSNPYNYMKSGHAQTESWRQGLHGVYALSFGDTPDFGAIWDPMGMVGYVSAAGRGRVIGNGIAGRDGTHTYTVGFANASAQYWATAAASNGSFGCYGMKPGTYTMTIYKGELEVYTESVSVTAGNPTTLNTRTIADDPSTDSAIWRMGDWDGTPAGFLNQTAVLTMHASDHRLSSWGPKTVTSSQASSWPCYLFRDHNNGSKITFNLSSADVAAHTIRIGITAANSGGRPQIQVNGWNSPGPGSSTQPDSRILTIGTYRGNNVMYTYNVPASAFVAGSNTLTVNCISGSGVTTGWTGASFSFDCLDLLR